MRFSSPDNGHQNNVSIQNTQDTSAESPEIRKHNLPQKKINLQLDLSDVEEQSNDERNGSKPSI